MTNAHFGQIDRVHPELKRLLEAAQTQVAFSRETLGAVRAPSDARHALRPVYGSTVPGERFIDTPEGPLRLYVFDPSPGTLRKPCLLWFHGGGFVMGKGRDPWMGPLFAERAGCVVVSVDYRLAPEHPFPAAIHDGMSALEWVHRAAATLGIDPDRIAVGGASAGAGLAAGLCLFNQGGKGLPIRFQLLLYPMLDNLHDTPSGRLPDNPVWSRDMSLAAWEMYLNGTLGPSAPHIRKRLVQRLTAILCFNNSDVFCALTQQRRRSIQNGRALCRGRLVPVSKGVSGAGHGVADVRLSPVCELSEDVATSGGKAVH